MIHSSQIALYAMYKSGFSKMKVAECEDFAKYLLREYHHLPRTQKNQLSDEFRFTDTSSAKRKTTAMKLIERLFSNDGQVLGISGNNGIEMGFSQDPSVAFISYIGNTEVENDPIYALFEKSTRQFNLRKSA